MITLEGTYDEKIGLWLDNFVNMISETVNQLIRNLQASIDLKIKNLKVNISSKRSIYKKRREDKLARLHEAYQIAKEIGIHDYDGMSNISAGNDLSVFLGEKKIYMYGTKMLQAEITILKNRKSDDMHIVGLRDLQEQLARLVRY